MYRIAMNTINKEQLLKETLSHCVSTTNLVDAPKVEGKVRDIYDLDDRLLLVTTDRISAFDRALTTVPFKGEILNQLSAFWFEKTKHIVKNHLISIPHKDSMLVKKLEVFPIEFVVRNYITGSTNTSLWTLYQQGVREVGQQVLPDGLIKNQKLPQPIITPTTKAVVGDKPIEREGILSEGFMTAEDFDKTAQIALDLFKFGSEHAEKNGLILVDTKFEFAKDSNGDIVLVDEVLTPDSSRYWRLSNYEQRMKDNVEPDNFDKEIIRLWYKGKCDPYQDKELPKAPDELRIQVAKIYASLFEQITGTSFAFTQAETPAELA